MARSHWCILIGGLVLIAAPSFALAQINPYSRQPKGQLQQQQQQQQQQAHQEFHSKGEFDTLVGSGGFVAELDGNRVTLAFEPKGKPKIEVTGTATADFLAPGMFVKFKGDFKKNGDGTGEVKDLEIFTPSDKEPLAATPAGGAVDVSTSKKGGPSNFPTTYDIAGHITGAKNGTITVSCPGLTVHAVVAQDATIKVNVADLRFARSGDKVEVHGWAGNMKGRAVAYATEVKVQSANPLSGPPKKGTHPAKTADKLGNKSTDAGDSAFGDAKKSDKPKNGADAKAGDAKAGDAKAGDAKPDDPKAGDKAADAKADKDAGK
jgi:hypothetical protein